jgi:hypothetical protein
MGVMEDIGILDSDKKITEDARKAFVDQTNICLAAGVATSLPLLSLFSESDLPFPSWDATLGVIIAGLFTKDSIEEHIEEFDSFHTIHIDTIYESIAVAIDSIFDGTSYPIFPIVDYSALLPDINIDFACLPGPPQEDPSGGIVEGSESGAKKLILPNNENYTIPEDDQTDCYDYTQDLMLGSIEFPDLLEFIKITLPDIEIPDIELPEIKIPPSISLPELPLPTIALDLDIDLDLDIEVPPIPKLIIDFFIEMIEQFIAAITVVIDIVLEPSLPNPLDLIIALLRWIWDIIISIIEPISEMVSMVATFAVHAKNIASMVLCGVLGWLIGVGNIVKSFADICGLK